MSRRLPPGKRRTPRPSRRWAEWALVRGWAALFALAADWLAAAAPSRFRSQWLRILRRDLGKLEQVLRCLLLLMRAPRTLQSPAPVIVPRHARKGAIRQGRRPMRFSVTLRHFSWYTPPPASQSVPGRSRQAPRHHEDPALALQRRLASLRAVFADPGPHAARIAAACHALGLRPRHARTWLVMNGFWFRLASPARRAFGAAAPCPDTS